MEKVEQVDGGNNVDDFEKAPDQDDEQVVKYSAKETKQFTGKAFRKLLSSENAFEALKKFIALHQQNDGKDLAAEYIKEKGSVLEILQLLDVAEKKNISNATTVFAAMHIVIMKILSQFPNQIQLTEQACHHLINSHLSTIHSMLSSQSKAKSRKVVLKLLAAIVTLGDPFPRELLNHLSLHSELVEFLVSHVRPTDPENVRTCFIHFILAFLVEGDVSVIRTLLEKRGVVSSIFSDLIYDFPHTVQLVLTTVKKYVLENSGISKTIKLHVFSTQVIQGIVNLYNWKGPKNWTGNKKQKSTVTAFVDPEDKEIAVNAVHEFLLTLLTSNRHGIAFHDRKLGSDSSRKHNQLINTVLQRLEKPWEHAKPSELVVKILSACPDLIKSQLLLAEPFLVPRVSKKWVSLIEFLRKIIENINVENCLRLCSPDMTTVQLTNAITNLTMPQTIIKNAIIPSLEQTNPLIHYEIIKLVSVMITKIKSFSTLLGTVKSNITDIPALKTNLLGQLTKHIPTFETIIITWKRALSVSSGQNSDTDETDLFVEVKDRLQAVLDLLQIYCEICPEILLISASNAENEPKILLTSLNDVPSMTEEELTMMKVKALKILLCSDALSFAPNEEIFTSALSLLLTKVGHESSSFDFEVINTIKLLINSCGIFEGCNDEIEIWIDAITYIDNHEDKLEVSNWIAKTIKRVSKNVEKYVSLISQVEENAVEEIVSVNKIDDIFDDLMERNFKEIKSVTSMLPLTSISLLIYGAIENLKKSPSNALAHYVSVILVHSLHCQVSSKAFLSLVEDLKTPAQKYLTSWSSDRSPSSIKKPFDSQNIFRSISTILLDPSKNCSIEVKESLLCLKVDGNVIECKLTNFQVTAVLRMVMFYLTQIVRRNGVEPPNISVYTDILLALLKLARQIEVDSEDLIKDCLEWIFKHPIVLHYFEAIHETKGSAEYGITKFLIQICKSNEQNLISHFLQPYQEKFINVIKLTLKKQKENNAEIDIEIPTELIKVLQLDVDRMVDLLSAILDLKKNEFVLSDKSKLSIWGILVPELISKLYVGEIRNESGSFVTIQDNLLKKLLLHLVDLKTLYKQDVSSWENNLYEYLVKFPHNISVISVKLFTRLLETNLTPSLEKIINLLCERNDKFIAAFIKHTDSSKRMLQKKSLIFSILSSNSKYQWNREFINKIYESHKSDIVQYLTEPQVDKAPWIHENVQAVVFLIESFFDSESCKEICYTILSNGNKLDAVQEGHVKLYYSLFKKSLSVNPDALKNFTQLLLHVTVTALKKDSKNFAKLNYLYKLLINTIDTLKSKEADFAFEELGKNHLWPQFVRISLKSGLKPIKEDKKSSQPSLLIKALSAACEVAYKNNDCEEYVKTIFAMVTLHTEFKDTMTSNSQLKSDLVELLWVLVRKNKEIMSEAHIPIYLCAYNATLSKSDQFILKILQHYERNNMRFSDYAPFLWGKAAESHFGTEASLDTALYRERSISQILDQLVPETISRTIKFFPVARNLAGDLVDVENADQIYDPAFYLAVFCSLLQDCNDVPCHKVVHKGGLALTIVACSSACDKIRLAAYTVLSRFYCHLQQLGKSAKEKLLWIHFIEALCNGTAKLEQPLEKIRLNGFIATFLARATNMMTQPLNPLYSPLHAFLMAKPALDLDIIPEFLPLFHSSEVEHLAHRHWILEIIRDGFKDHEDMDIALKYLLFKMLFCYYNCILADDVTKKLILQTIRSATRLTRGCTILVNGYSLLPWLVNISVNLKKGDSESIACVIDIVNNIIDAHRKTKLKDTHHHLLIKILLQTKSRFHYNLPVDCFHKFVNTLIKAATNKMACNALAKDHLLVDLVELAKILLGDVNECEAILQFGCSFVKHCEIDGDACPRDSLYKLVHLSEFLKRPINVWSKERLICCVNGRHDSSDGSAIDVEFSKNSSPIGHFALKGGKEPNPRGTLYPNNCLFDCVASQTGFEPIELRREVIRRILRGRSRKYWSDHYEINRLSKSNNYTVPSIRRSHCDQRCQALDFAAIVDDTMRGGARYRGKSSEDAKKVLDESQKGRRHPDGLAGHPRGHASHPEATGETESVENYSKKNWGKPVTGFLSRSDQDVMAHRVLLTSEGKEAMDMLNQEGASARAEVIHVSADKFDKRDLRRAQVWVNGRVQKNRPSDVKRLTMVLRHFYDRHDDEDADAFVVTFYPRIDEWNKHPH
ncbi:nucleolar pre-ribosomal-associated protein 1 [Copidosoma floridanum]|uniref:nucleolar pre-ribosomal-associated protein 1 n=1 Tax=Copidosoma floridanum TaxID=29053 RepID=UPI0006C97913|nr:nucleolar pre-ribosomal-associated protein 1 [Copidosoma floridanum]